jgi:hypothetical protein
VIFLKTLQSLGNLVNIIERFKDGEMQGKTLADQLAPFGIVPISAKPPTK